MLLWSWYGDITMSNRELFLSFSPRVVEVRMLGQAGTCGSCGQSSLGEIYRSWFVADFVLFFCLKNHRARWNNNHVFEATSVYLYLCLMCLNKIREIHKQRKISEKQFRMIYPDFSKWYIHRKTLAPESFKCTLFSESTMWKLYPHFELFAH